MKLLAIIHNNIGRKLMGKKQAFEKAGTHFRKAAKQVPHWSVPWYNLGLLHKKQKNWKESLQCNQKAVELDPGNEAAWWNLGIAATALGNWAEARRAWKTHGVDISLGDEELVMNLGSVPIRLNPQGNGEVVWCSRIDPARAIVNSVPLPESRHHFGDILLHDGTPNGYRVVEGEEIPVLDELQVLVPSEYATFEVTLKVDSEGLQPLVDLGAQHQLGIEDWTTIRWLCRPCSEDRPGEYSEAEPQALQEPIHLAFASKGEKKLRDVLNEWVSDRSECEIIEVNCVLEIEQGCKKKIACISQ